MASATLVRWGNGRGIRISKRDMEDAGIEIGDKMHVETKAGSITLTREKPKKTVRIPDFGAMFAGYDGPRPTEDGAVRHPMGAEE